MVTKRLSYKKNQIISACFVIEKHTLLHGGAGNGRGPCVGLWNEPELWGKQALRERKTLSCGDAGEGGVGAFSGRERLLDELEELVGDVGGVFDLLEFIGSDAADGSEEPGRVGLPLLDGAHALGGIE